MFFISIAILEHIIFFNFIKINFLKKAKVKTKSKTCASKNVLKNKKV